MGDGIAVGAAGIWMGFYSILRVLIWGLLMAAGAAMILLMQKSKRKELPLVPFLAAAFLTERKWGDFINMKKWKKRKLYSRSGFYCTRGSIDDRTADNLYFLCA